MEKLARAGRRRWMPVTEAARTKVVALAAGTYAGVWWRPGYRGASVVVSDQIHPLYRPLVVRHMLTHCDVSLDLEHRDEMTAWCAEPMCWAAMTWIRSASRGVQRPAARPAVRERPRETVRVPGPRGTYQ